MQRYRDLQQVKQGEHRKNQLVSAIDVRIRDLNNYIINNIGDKKLNQEELKDLMARRKWLAKRLC
jgi:hypothetical protein